MKSLNINPLQSTPAVFFMALFLVVSVQTFGQAVSLTPSPTGPDDLVTLTIDVSQSQEHGLKAVLEANPDLPVYIWTWSPSGPVAGNGEWNNSNDAMQLSWQGGLVYSLQFVPSEFYSDVSSLFSNGISCLAKLKDGAPYPGFEDFGEAKTEDFNIGVLPKLCEEQMCKFPEIRRLDDVVSITYNSNIDTVLTDIVDDDVYLQVSGRGTDGVFYTMVPDDQVASTPELKMSPVEGRPGFYRWTLLPVDFFAPLLPEGVDLLTMTCYPLKPNFVYPPDTDPWNGIYYIESVEFSNCP